MPYTAPYMLPAGQPPLPAGEFLLPVCTTIDRLTDMLNALNAYRNLSAEHDDQGFMIDVLRALAHTNEPEKAPCSPFTSPEEQCITYWPQHPKLNFAPGVVNGDTAPPAGYAQHPWFTGDNYVIPGFTLQPTDVLFDINSVRPVSGSGFIEQITSSGFPRFQFTFSGSGTVELHLVRIPLGGTAIVRLDDLNVVEVIDLNSYNVADVGSLLSFLLSLVDIGIDGAFVNDVIHEVTVDTPGNHKIDVLFLPNIALEIPPVGWGGGIRKVVLCGFEVECDNCDDCEDCPEPDPCEDCPDIEDIIEEEIGFDLEELEMLLDCYKHSTGDIKMHAAATGAGASWLLCDGSMHAKDQYPDLYAVLSGKTSETETEFAVPDFSLKSPMGVGDGLAALAAAGESTHVLTVGEMPEHDHSFGSHVHEVGGHTHPSPAHTHDVTPSPHIHTLPTLTIPTKNNSEPGGGGRLMRASAPGTDTQIDIPLGSTGAESLGTSGTSVTVQANTPFNTGAASGTSGAAGDGDAFDIVHPVLGVYFFIFAGCAISESDCA